jgi:uncharacterized membrane protein
MTETAQERETQRLEAFSDGVFAIAITLLVLEIRVPHLEEGEILSGALLRLWPSYAAYAFSFLMIGIFWVNHHSFFRLFRRVNHAFLVMNVFFLMFVSFIPFPTAVLADHLKESELQTAVTFYTLGLALPVLMWFGMWLYGSRQYRLIDPRLAPSYVMSLTRQYAVSNALYISAVLISLVSAVLGLVICVGLSLLYLFPPKQPRYRDFEAGG